ncbi:MAG TPA: alpha/beta hydrolase [Candidatus Eisenbacteria bacterium]|nr:alpha/beta hydrolase [Candidatus Eisenbacteria bacterium]
MKPVSGSNKQTIVLVHGAFADGSCWSKVIPVLEEGGYHVIAVQNPLTSFADDVATTRRVIDAQSGPVIVVGHSYGGAVITSAAADAPNVKALVYVAAFAPDDGESIGPLLEKYPSKLGAAVVPDAAGFLYIDRAKFKEAFAADVPDLERSVMAATQKPINGVIFGQVFGTPAWRSLPSWFLVACQDQATNPDLERMFAKRMRATTVEVDTSHVPFMSRPADVVAIIEEAAEATQPATVGQR